MSVVLRIVLDGEPGTLLVPESKVTQANMTVLAQNERASLNVAAVRKVSALSQAIYVKRTTDSARDVVRILKNTGSSLETATWIVINP
ncbi:MAG: hypothetical protein QOE52_3647 [Mycobacterium sp.]|nr:hypothetical protein [Mycobacterium sp.]